MPEDTQAGLYVHIPYCRRICPYCDFAVTRGSAEDRSRYVRLIEAEMQLWSDEPFRFDTIYLGGGTPSTLAADDLARLLEAAREQFAIAPDARLYLEAHPEDGEPAILRRWRRLGIHTISLGIQSLDRRELRSLGRRHDPEHARRCVAWSREAGFETVSIDLIYGLPGQDAAAWRRTLEEAVALAPDHLSCYQLTFHERTPYGTGLRKGVLREAPEAVQAALFELTHEFLRDAGYEGYEVSNFARAPRHRSLHNLKYWRHAPYLGLGASAHSFRGRERWWNERRVEAWARSVAAGARPVAGSEILSSSELALEALMLGLRTSGGIDLAAFQAAYRTDLLARNRKRIERWVDSGLAGLREGRFYLTIRGMAVADAITRDIET